MIDDGQLLQLARELSTRKSKGTPRKAYLRRSISSAYYALFHCLANRATCDLVGQDYKSPRFGLIYRSFEHTEMRAACERATKRLPDAFGQESFGPDLQLCARTFIELQKLRHDADYDPQAKFALSDVQNAVLRAETAMQKLGEAPENERRLFLLTLRYKHRS
jgi:uncharacterized protein (UPF0332 family)